MSYIHLNREDRIILASLLKAGHTQKYISIQLNKDPSTISRELSRNKDSEEKYLPGYANTKTKERRWSANQASRKITVNSKLEEYIIKKLKKYWSPEQISGRLAREKKMNVIHHETIYQWIYNKRPEFKKYLRCKKRKYRRRYGTKIREKQRELAKKKSIDIRPKIVEERSRLGDWEGDTIVGGEKTTGILTYADRKSGYLLADILTKGTAENVKMKTIKRFYTISKRKKLTITYDNGREFSDHETIEVKTKIPIYFAHPYHSWERGTNENTNGLLRQFFPKKMPLANVCQEQVARAVKLINNRPRKRLNYLTPHEVFRKNCSLD
jgi:IS30 family transposase